MLLPPTNGQGEFKNRRQRRSRRSNDAEVFFAPKSASLRRRLPFLNTPCLNGLPEIIRREMAACGSITFARFMELSLYCPQFGYYEQIANTPGRRGDYYTSVSVGPLFGQLLAAQFAQWLGQWETRSVKRG